MGYFNIQFTKDASALCAIILPWVKNRYKRLPMGLSNSPDIFQQKSNDLLRVFRFICVYIDGILIITKIYWKDHEQKYITYFK